VGHEDRALASSNITPLCTYSDENANNSVQNTLPNIDNDTSDYTSKLKQFRCKYPYNIILYHLNVNSFRYKFNDCCQFLHSNLADICIFSETKLDESFPISQFRISNYSVYRKDRNSFGGGIIVYINSVLPHCVRNDFNDLFVNNIEGLVLEISIKKRKWLILAIYKPPRVSDVLFISSFMNIFENLQSETPYVTVAGDLNFDMNHNNSLIECCNILGLKNLISGDTCYKSEISSSIDVILTPNSNMFVNDCINVDVGISDFHNLVGCVFKAYAPKRIYKEIQFRSYRKFDENKFLCDLSQTNVSQNTENANIDEKFRSYNDIFLSVLDEHAPIKTRILRKPSPPFMNHELKSAIYKKCMLRNIFYKNKTDKNWEIYRTQRNLVTRIRRQSIRSYFVSKTDGVTNSRQFWKIMKPFVSDKNSVSDDSIILRENDELITDSTEVCKVFNNYFVNVAETIGFKDEIPFLSSSNDIFNHIITKYCNHPSIIAIKTNGFNHIFDFEMTSEEEVKQIILKLDIKKSMGYDFISPKIIKLSCQYITPIITDLINYCIMNNVFPTDLKMAEISAIFKKKDKLNKENYRPISILIILSKVYEKVFCVRINNYFQNIFSPFLSAYRPGYNCEQVLIAFISFWKKALDENIFFGAVMMDLSKAFDCLPHCLLIAKLHAYGFSQSSCLLVAAYLSNRQQRVKLGSSRSSWLTFNKGVPQGSILGPVLFNIFIHDMFYFTSSILLNYADDNTIVCSNSNLECLVQSLSRESNVAVKWFSDNGMQANPGKFQCIISHRSIKTYKSIPVGDITIVPQKSVKLLGVIFDVDLTFDEHIDDICKKASKSLNVLKRFSKILNIENKKRVFHSYIASQFNYCPIIWHFCYKRKTYMMEKIQERALRFVFNDQHSTYYDLLLRINKDTMHVQRLKQLMNFVYKCVNKLGPSNLNDLFTVKTSPYVFRNNLLLYQPKINTVTHGINSLIYHGAKIWNHLPMYVKTASSAKQFKSFVKKYKHSLCDCSHCLLDLN
jgi:hypothetical protein